MTRTLIKDARVASGAGLLLVMALMAVFADQLAPHDPNVQDLANRFAPPGGDFLLGTDAYGRDTLSRLIVGSRFSLFVGIISVAAGGAVGSILGMVGGFVRGWFDVVLMRLTDALLAFPILLIALLMVATLGPSIRNLIIAIAIAVMPRFVRIVRGAVIGVASLDYVTAARVVGTRVTRMLRLEIAPNITSPLIVTASFMIATAILVEASLGFLGLGVQPPTPTWGNMINEALPRVRNWPAGAAYPGLAIMFAVLAFNLLGDGLRDVLDPKTVAMGPGKQTGRAARAERRKARA